MRAASVVTVLSVLCSLALLFAAATCCSAAPAILAHGVEHPTGLREAQTVSVATDDGVVLTLNNDGSWHSLTVNGNPIPELPGVTGGFVVEMMDGVQIPTGRDQFYPGTPIVGEAIQVEVNTVRIVASTPIGLTGESLSFDIKLTGGQPFIQVNGTVTGPGTDHVFFVYFRLPVDASGWTYWYDLYQRDSITTDPSNWYFCPHWFIGGEHPSLSIWPYGSITKTGEPQAGLSLAPFFYPPSAYAIQYNSQGGFWIEFELGTTPKTTKHPNTCDFHFVLYQHDPDWGARSAVARYYTFFPEWFHRVSRGGNWMGDLGSRPPNPGDFAITYLETYDWDDAWTTANSIYTCKYQEPWCWHLTWPVSEIEYYAQDIPENDEAYFLGKGQSIKESAQQAILSTICNPDGTYVGPGDDWLDDGICSCGDQTWHSWRWVTNPDVEIANDRSFNPGRNRGQSLQYWEWYRQWGQEPGPDHHYSGLYHDSVGGWSGWGWTHDFRESHWPYYDCNPGVYMGSRYDSIARGTICMWPPYSNVEFAKLAHEQMTREGRVVMANSNGNYELFMMAPFLDMIGAGEDYWSCTHRDEVVRAIAGKKPSSFLFGAQTDEAMKECLLFGIYPGMGSGENYESYRPLYRKYMPIFNAIDAAGWEPVTAARASDPSLYLERFGPDAGGALYLVLRSPLSSRAFARITVSSADLGWPSYPTVAVTELTRKKQTGKDYDAHGNLVIIGGFVDPLDTKVYRVTLQVSNGRRTLPGRPKPAKTAMGGGASWQRGGT